MNIGTLNIEIATNVARIQADMQAAKTAVTSSMGEIEKAVGFAKNAFVLLGGVTSIAALRGIVEGGIEAKANLYDLSVQTGITVEALSGLGKVAKYSHTELTDIAGASNKLSKALFTQNEDSKGAAQALKALGLNFSEFKALSADQQFQAVAKSMGEFEDGTAKSAAAMLLYGKTGATLLPFLKELEERGYAAGKQTTASALEAKKYEDNLITLKIAADAWKRTLAEAVLPTMIRITDSFIDARKEVDSFNLAGAGIKVVFETLSVLGANVAFVFGGVGREIGAIAAQAVAVSQGNFAGAAAIRDAVIADGKQARAELDATEAKLMGVKSKIGTAADFQRGDKDASPVARKKLGLSEAGEPKALKDIADGYDALMKKLRDKIDLDKMELDLGRQLTDSEKLGIEVRNEVKKNFDKLSDARKRSIEETLQQALALGKERKAQEDNNKWIREATDANASYVEGKMQLRDQMQQQRKLEEQQLAMYGLTTEELQALESARLRDAAAALDRQGVLAQDVDLTGQLTQLYRDQADALRGTAIARDMLAAKEAKDRNDPLAGANRAVKEYMADVKRAGDATYGAVGNAIKGLEDLTVTALTGGNVKNAARAWVNGIISEVVRLQTVKPLIAGLFGESGGGSGGGWLSTVGSLVGSYFGGGGMSTNTTGGSLPTSGGRAAGGPVDGGKNYLVGEKGPEILRMGSQAGTVVPNDAIGGGSRSVVVNVTNNGQAVQAKSSQRETSQGTIIDLVLDAVANDMASGGKLHDATQRRFGLSAGGSTPRY